MKSLTKYVEQIPCKEKFQIIQDYELFEIQGFIGESVLRTHAQNFLKLLGGGEDYIVPLWIDRLAIECYKYYAKLYIENNDLKNFYRD